MNAWKYNSESTRMISKLLINMLGITYKEIYKEVEGFEVASPKGYPGILQGIISLKNGDECVVRLSYKHKGN